MNKLEEAIILGCGSQEPSSFNEVLRAIGDEAPGKDSSTTWALYLSTLRTLERLGYIEIDRNSQGNIDTLILTPEGAAEARHLQVRS